MKAYAPVMGISLPLDEEDLFRISQNFYGQEVSYTMWADELREHGDEWESIEGISNMFADAATELSDLEDDDNFDYALLSELVEKVESCPGGDYPEYHQWYSKDGKPVDF